MSFPSRFLGELQRRSVVKVAVGYTVSAWLLVQVASIVIPAFGWPDWVMRATLIALVAGFPVVCILAWVYEWSSLGIRREDDTKGAGDPPERREPAAAGSVPDGEALEPSTILGRLASWEVAMVGLVMAGALGIGLFSLSRVDAARPQHIAILPFRVVSAQAPEAELLAAGLMETLTSSVTQFGQVEQGLWVVPAAEISDDLTPSGAREQFGVSLVVSGSMQFAGQSIRLTLNLVDAVTGRQVQSRQIDVVHGQMIDLQDEATKHLARMLDIRRTGAQALAGATMRPENPDAVRLYFEGRGLLRGATSVSQIDAAIESFVRAASIDSAYALAAAGLGEAYWQKYKLTSDVKWVSAAITQSQRALSLDSTLAPVWTTLGILRSDQQHQEAAIEALQKAIQIDPRASDPYRHLATVYRRQGDLERAEVTYREAISRQPEYWKNYNMLGAFYYSQGRYKDAVTQYTRGLRLASANPNLLNNIAVAYWQMEELDRAMASFEKLVRLDSSHTSAVANLATAYFYNGRYNDAADLYAKVLRQYPKDHSLAGALADAQMWSASYSTEAPTTYRKAVDLAREQLTVRSDPWVHIGLATYYHRLEQPDSSRIWLDRLEDEVGSENPSVVMSFSIGAVYESIGEREKAWSWIQSALDQDYGWIPLAYSPFLADLRKDARAVEYLNRHAEKGTASDM